MRDYNIIAVDFDGTLCENNWPKIGFPNFKLIRDLITYQEQGDKLILWTCRVGDRLNEAVEWCRQHGLIFDAVNENLPEMIQDFGGDSRKIFADIYIDDRNDARYKLPFDSEYEEFVDYVLGDVEEMLKRYIENLKRFKRNSIRAAKILGYGDTVIQKLKAAKTINEIDRIMSTARKKY